MSEEELKIWKELNEFELDDPDAEFSFTDRLSRENGWPLYYCVRAIEEYKKFIFLIKFSKHPCTPSDEIDQVWHLHLIYTQSYWKEMCEGILGIEIHHGPTKGISQRADFKEFYTQTLQSYQLFFKQKPPEDIWPPLNKRFKYVNFRRVNLHNNWIIKKWKY